VCNHDTSLDELENVEDETLDRLEAQDQTVGNKSGKELARLRIER
jgi:hypothetical protein